MDKHSGPYPKTHTCLLCGREGYFLERAYLCKPYGTGWAHKLCYARYRLRSRKNGIHDRGKKATTHSIEHDFIRLDSYKFNKMVKKELSI